MCNFFYQQKSKFEVVTPIFKLNKENIQIKGPFSSDSFFGSGKYKEFNAVMGIYHDQALIPFKTLSFGSGVNFTAGLDVVRTSPDHGTGYDIAGKNIANPIATILSLSMALRYSLDLSKEADQIDKAVQSVLDEGLRTKDIMSKNMKEVSTTEMGDAIIAKLK